MTRLYVVGAALLIAAGSFKAAAAGEWKKFSPPDGKFTVLLPGDPIEEKTTQNTAVGATQRTTYACQVENGEDSSVFAVSVSEYPPSTAGIKETHREGVSEEHANVLVESAANGAIKNFQGQLRGTAQVTLGSYTGKEITLESPTTVFISRYFWVAPRLYMVQVVTTPEQKSALDSTIAKFFNSFEVKEDKPKDTPPANTSTQP
jgi:hypothetical protein